MNKKLKYYINNKVLLGLFFIFVFIILFVNLTHAETIIYDNLTTSNYKVIILNDDLNIKYINDYSYDIYLNDAYLGNYHKNDKIFIPDDSNITIYIPENNIKTDISNIWDIAKTNFYIALMFLISGFIIIALIIIFILKIWRK